MEVKDQLTLIKEASINWIRNHKRDIIVATSSILITSYVYYKYGLNNNDSCFMRFDFDNEFERDDEAYLRGHVTLKLKNYLMRDLGKLGKELIKSYPNLFNESTIINMATVSYNFLRKNL